MTKTVKIWFNKTDEIKEIFAKYVGVTADKVGLGRDDDGNFFAVVEKELTFPDKPGQVSVSVGTYNPLVAKTTTPLISTATEYTGYLPGTYDSPTNISETGTSINEESIRKSIDNIRAEWTKADALSQEETSNANK